MKKTFIKGFTLSLIALAMVSGCKKESSSSSDQDISTVEINAQGDEFMMDSFSEIGGFSTENSGMFGVDSKSNSIKSAPASAFGDCVNLTISAAAGWPKTLTADFGSGCTIDGVTRSGKIIAVFSAPIFTKDAKVSLTFDNYVVNGTKIQGTKEYTNNGKNAAGNYSYTVVVNKAVFTKDSKSFTWSCNRTVEWTQGSATLTAADDVFSVTGTAEGTTADARNFTASTTKALIKKTACTYISAGTVSIKSNDKTYTLDFGTGDCDDKATVTGPSFTRQITLHK